MSDVLLKYTFKKICSQDRERDEKPGSKLHRVILKITRTSFFNKLKEPSVFGGFFFFFVFKIHTFQSVADVYILSYLELSVSSFLFITEPLCETTSAQPLLASQRPVGLVSCLHTGLCVISPTDLHGKVYTSLYSYSARLICQAP